MADGKNSFLLYKDVKFTIDKLTDEKAGQLFKHILNYVNDLNPITEDFVIEIAFEPIKQALKRDLKKWENICIRNKDNGSKGGRPKNPSKPKKPTGLSGNPKNPNEPDIDIDIDIDIDSVIVNDKKEKNIFSFKDSLIDLGIEQQIVSDWLKVRSKKKASNTETAFKSIKSEIEKSGLTANECIKEAVERDWKGFKSDWLKDSKKSTLPRLA